jgi:hypothetical protein
MEKNPEVEHTTRDVDQLPYYIIPGYQDRLKMRKKTLPILLEKALSTIGEIESAIDEYKAAVEQVIVEYTTKVDQEVMVLQGLIEQLKTKAKKAIRDLTAESEEQIAKLNEMKRDMAIEIDEALKEVERTVIQDKPQLVSRYGHAFRDLN